MHARRWLLAGIGGALIILSLLPLWDAWMVNIAGTLVNRAVASQMMPSTIAENPCKNDTATADNSSEDPARAAAAADIAQAMTIMEAVASRGPNTAAREIPIWRTYGAAAALCPSSHAYELLYRSLNAGWLDRIGELWFAEVAAATQHIEEAREAYARMDASNLLIYRAELLLQSGDKELAIRQYLLAKASLEAAIERETAEKLLLDRTGNQPSKTSRILQPAAERVTSLYRIGRGLLSSGEPLQAIPVLEQALERAESTSPGTLLRQSLALNLALALAMTLPSKPNEHRSTGYYPYAPEEEAAAYVEALIRIRTLVYQGLKESRTASACLQAARILLLTDDARQAVALFEETIELDPRLAETYLNLGSWYESKGLTVLARCVYEKGAQQLPNDAKIVAAYAISSYKTVAAADALGLLERAAAMDTTDPYLFAHLGDCYRDLGLTFKARMAYEEGLRRAPGATPLLNRLAGMPTLPKAQP